MSRLKRGILSILIWTVIAILGAAGLATIALHRGETISAAWLLTAAIGTYLVAYRFYSRFIATKIMQLDDNRATPAEVINDGKDFVPTNKWVVYGHHFAAIAGAGPLVGPILAAQMGYLPARCGSSLAPCSAAASRTSSSSLPPCAATGRVWARSPKRRSDRLSASLP